MLFDVFFLGFPIVAAICMVNLALRERDMRFWRCGFSFFAYIVFYMAGGRDVLLYICSGMLIAHSWISIPM